MLMFEKLEAYFSVKLGYACYGNQQPKTYFSLILYVYYRSYMSGFSSISPKSGSQASREYSTWMLQVSMVDKIVERERGRKRFKNHSLALNISAFCTQISLNCDFK